LFKPLEHKDKKKISREDENRKAPNKGNDKWKKLIHLVGKIGLLSFPWAACHS